MKDISSAPRRPPGGRRYRANSGQRVDVESDTIIAQCKLVRRLRLEVLTQLAEQVAHEIAPKFKAGVVAVKVRRGRGRPSPMLIVMTERVWRSMTGGASGSGPASGGASGDGAA